nr:serine/threonine-protein kinase D6PKL2-like [Tanacetum cinerariifolium]
MDNKLTLANIVDRPLEFPKEPAIPPMTKDLISQLMAKDPARRLGSTMGASAIKHHSFFQGVNWALLRCAKPPFVPPPFNISSREVVSDDSSLDHSFLPRLYAVIETPKWTCLLTEFCPGGDLHVLR